MNTATVPQPSCLSLEFPVGPIGEPSLASKAMLSSVSIRVWPASKYDPNATEEIAIRHKAQKDAGRYNKKLFPREALEELNKIAGEARQDHYFLTLPWSDEGFRVLPAATYMEHRDKMRGHLARFEPAVNRFEARFADLVTEQSREHSRLGTLFNIDDYPGMHRLENGKMILLSAEELRSKFSFETKVKPITDASDFRVSMGDEEQQRIKRQIEASVQASLQVGTRDLWQRLYQVVRHLSDRLTEYNATEKGSGRKLYDAWISNIVEIVDVLPRLNITGDTELTRMASEVRASLVIDPDELRKSESVCTDTAKAATAIAERMAAYMGVPAATAQGMA
jgi:hypothetical protein